MSDSVHPDVLQQLESLRFDPDRPLIISDADEVIFAFVRGLEDFLDEQDLYLDLKSFAITGNIRSKGDHEAIDAEQVRAIVAVFHQEKTQTMPLVPGAIEALNRLKREAQVMVLSNTPLAMRQARTDTLARHGLAVPLVANIGRKGPAVAYLARRHAAAMVFIDDIPHNIKSVSEDAPKVTCLHFIGDPRLAKLLGPAAGSDARIDNWPNAIDYILAIIGAAASD